MKPAFQGRRQLKIWGAIIVLGAAIGGYFGHQSDRQYQIAVNVTRAEQVDLITPAGATTGSLRSGTGSFLNNDFTVNGTVTLNDNAHDTTTGRDFTVGRNALVTGTLTSNGTTTLGDATHDTTVGRDLIVTRNFTATGGTSQTDGLTCSTLHATSTSTFDGLATVKAKLQVNNTTGVGNVIPTIDSRTSSPNGVVTAAEGSLIMDGTNGNLWINSDGGTTWTQILGSGTGTVTCAQLPALVSDVTTAGASCTTTIAANVVTNAKLAQAGALTVKGNATNGAANVTDIASSAAGQYLVRTSSNTLAWELSPQASYYFGPGTDGSITFDGVATPVAGATLSGSTYTMTRDITATAMTVNNAIEVKTVGYRVFVKGTLTNNGKIDDNGAAATNTANCTPRAAGIFPGPIAAAGVSNVCPFPYCTTQAAVTQGANGGACQNGGGGNGTNPAGSNGAMTQTAPTRGATLVDDMMKWRTSDGSGTALTGAMTGSAGGTGAGCTVGGGGCGGGMVYVGAYTMTGTGTIEAKGGNGFTGSVGGNCGGGGGGGGGFVTMVYLTRSGNACSVTGGSGGAALGTGTAGGNGGTCSCVTYNLSGDGT